jgi:hypothetical protein
VSRVNQGTRLEFSCTYLLVDCSTRYRTMSERLRPRYNNSSKMPSCGRRPRDDWPKRVCQLALLPRGMCSRGVERLCSFIAEGKNACAPLLRGVTTTKANEIKSILIEVNPTDEKYIASSDYGLTNTIHQSRRHAGNESIFRTVSSLLPEFPCWEERPLYNYSKQQSIQTETFRL